MSRLDDLIATHCPRGVPYASVTDVADYVRGITYSKSDEHAEGNLRVLRANNITLASNTLNRVDVRRVADSVRVRDNQHLKGGDILMCAGSGSKEHIGKVAFIPHDTSETFGGFMAVIRSKGDIEPRFLFHLLTASTFLKYLGSALSTTTINNLNVGIMRNYRVPVPPLEVQREIVRILDQFSQLEAELEAELEARRLQYAHYRDALLNTATRPDVLWAPLRDVGVLIRGRRFTRADVVDAGIPSIHYGEIYTRYGVSTREAFSSVREELRPRLRFAEQGDVVIAAVGETVEDVGKAVAWLGDGPVAIHDDTFLFRSDLEPRFVSQFMQSAPFNRQKEQYVARAKIKRLSGDGLGRIMMPVPPREEQERVVDLLGRFETLVNDLSVGLPAELAARRQQYEHYRDRLLTFEEAAA